MTHNPEGTMSKGVYLLGVGVVVAALGWSYLPFLLAGGTSQSFTVSSTPRHGYPGR